MLENFLQPDQHLIETFGETPMNEYSQMVAALAKPGQDIIDTLTPFKAHILHMTIGMCGEASGEVKALDFPLPGTAVDSTLLEELGDTEFYFEGFCQAMQITIPSEFQVPVKNESGIDLLVVATGNLLDQVKKLVIYNKEIEPGVLTAYLLDVRNALDTIYAERGLTQEMAKEHNLNKLLKGKNARYKGGEYSDQAAQDRRDKSSSPGAGDLLLYAIGEDGGSRGYALQAGPTSALDELKQLEGKSEMSCILSFDKASGESVTVVARWDKELNEWIDVTIESE